MHCLTCLSFTQSFFKSIRPNILVNFWGGVGIFFLHCRTLLYEIISVFLVTIIARFQGKNWPTAHRKFLIIFQPYYFFLFETVFICNIFPAYFDFFSWYWCNRYENVQPVFSSYWIIICTITFISYYWHLCLCK